MKEYVENGVKRTLDKKHFTQKNNIAFIRYADDFVILHTNKEVIEKAQEVIQELLGQIGLELSEEKTRIVHTTEGFDFLGFNIKHYPNKANEWHQRNDKRKNQNKNNKKLLIKPSKKSIKAHNEKIHDVLDTMKAATQDEVIDRLNPIIKGWANYFKAVVSSKTFLDMNKNIWKKIWRWSKRRHSNKGRKWIANNYFHTIKGRKWRFSTKTKGQISNVLALHTDRGSSFSPKNLNLDHKDSKTRKY
jgi:RNA-directed DNA polymerase